ncbi:Xaa-Pro peptidase family protein (plasmid) [Deinococcus sp. KNUC1210]|uniref:M24 family metallopeptidase n=1 Tax=Deinococcus sp. KNUC1210 TaxID=2917691 RepID=UPI001EF1047F|nr:Xaa-Pro peptidase family protein [Deinococcus sp. KNUC1210]ULH16996.1 Xaa-Pro peptidase family protein [Deinococcus sp. KNUC1210]
MADLRPHLNSDRLAALRGLLDRERAPGIEAVLITAPSQLRALCGVRVSAGALVLTAHDSVLLLDPRYLAAVTVPGGVTLRPYANARTFAEGIREVLGNARRIGVYAPALSLAAMNELNPRGELEFVPIDAVLDDLHSLLNQAETESLQQAEALTRRAIAATFAALRPGISERQLERVLLDKLAEGGEGPAFPPIVAFGEQTALPHAHPGDTIWHPGDLVTIDAGAVVDGLHADLTDTRLVGGTQEDTQAHALLNLTHQALEAAIRATRAGVSAGEIDEAARAVFRAAGLDAQTLLGIGHALGYQVHQAPILRAHSRDEVQVGQVLALEPGVYLPGFGGVRLEEMVVVTEAGAVPIAGWRSPATVAGQEARS